MKLLPLIGAALLGLGACSDAQVEAAKGHADQALDGISAAANKMADEVRAVDWGSLAQDGLKEKGSQVIRWSVEQLEGVKDSETAQKVAAGVGDVLDAGGGFLEEAAGYLPDRAALAEQVAQLREQHGQDTKVGKALDPVLQRLQQLLEP